MSGSGSGRRGRRGGRRQRKREEQQRVQRGAEASAAPASGAAPPAEPMPDPAPVVAAHPPPMSARALVARLEALRVEAAHEAMVVDVSQAATDEASTRGAAEAAPEIAHAPPLAPAHTPAGGPVPQATPAPRRAVEPRRFMVGEAEWIARLAGSGTGGTGHVAIGRLEAIQFALAVEPESVAAEVLVPRARLDEMYDDELIEMLEGGLEAGKRHG